MKQRIYVDVNAGVGRMDQREERIPYSVEALAEDMKYYRVHGAAVYSNPAREYAFTKGNAELLEQIAGNSRLTGIATVVPGIEFELDDWRGYFDGLLRAGIRAFKVCPAKLTHNMEPFYMERVAEYMIEHELPLFVDIGDTNWRELRETAQAFPRLNVVLGNTSWAWNRYLYPLMDKCPNLHFEISSNQANDVLLICKKHFGVDRVLFGTNWPFKVQGALKALVEYSGLSEDEKDAVAHGNAARLLKLDTAALKRYDDADCGLDAIARTVDEGRPLTGELVIDAHTHLVDREHFTVSQIPILNGDEDNMLRKADALGIDKIFISAWEGLHTDGLAANESDLQARDRYPDRIEAYAMCNPHYEEDLSGVIAYHEKYGFKGLKPYYPWNRYDLLGEKYAPWFEYGNAHKLIMLVHMGERGIAAKVDTLAGKYPDMTFLMAHSGISYGIARENIEVAKKHDNVYLEITFTSLTNGVIEYMVEEVGADRVIFGTDMPMRDPAPQLAWVTYARLCEADKRKILGGNIQRLLERCYK